MDIEELLQDVVSLPEGEAGPQSEENDRDDAVKPEGEDGADKPETKTEEKPEGEPEEKDEGDEDEGDKPRRQTRRERERRRIERLEAENAELRRSREAGGPAADEAKAPKFEDFNGDWDAFDAARIEWAADKAIRKARTEADRTESEARQREHRDSLVEEFQASQDRARKALPDFDEVIAKADGHKVAPHVGELILESEKSALLQYHLAQKPELLRELNAMSEREAARRIGRLEARLSLPTPKKATQAPAPVTAPKGGAAPGFDPFRASPADMAKHLGIKG